MKKHIMLVSVILVLALIIIFIPGCKGIDNENIKVLNELKERIEKIEAKRAETVYVVEDKEEEESKSIQENAIETTKDTTQNAIEEITKDSKPKVNNAQLKLPGPETSLNCVPDGTVLKVNVKEGYLGVATGGPGEYLGFKCPGGANPNIGFVFLLEPGEHVLNNVWPNGNWVGFYPIGEITKEIEMMLLEDRVVAMMKYPNGSDKTGCTEVYGAIGDGQELKYSKVYERQ